MLVTEYLLQDSVNFSETKRSTFYAYFISEIPSFPKPCHAK